MAFCQKCGTQVEDNAQFCASCGAPQGATPAPVDTTTDKVMGVLAYLGILVLIPILAAKDSRFARFHANQGLVLLLAGVICGAVSVIPILGWIAGSVGSVALFVFEILGIVNAIKYEEKELPIIGKFRILK